MINGRMRLYEMYRMEKRKAEVFAQQAGSLQATVDRLKEEKASLIEQRDAYREVLDSFKWAASADTAASKTRIAQLGSVGE